MPAGKGPFPAVVLMHGCRGLRGYQREWVRKLTNWGYVALLVGSFYRGGAELHRSPNALDVCSQMINWPGFDLASGRVFDAYGALEYLAGIKQVDMNRVGLISWDRDSSLSTVNEAGFQAYSSYRFAAAPNFFASPRVVIAVDGEPREIVAGQRPLRLNDRLFLGYQEQAKVLEVISYNEQASRFEFQVVEDYAEGLEPKVYYAKRAVCRSCHQNGSPIFSKAGWDETNGSPLITERLGEIRKDFYGLGYSSGTVGPAAVPAELDPLRLRPPLEVLEFGRAKDLEKMITGLAEDLPAADMLRLDRVLFSRGARDAATRRYRISAPCSVRRRGLARQGQSNPPGV